MTNAAGSRLGDRRRPRMDPVMDADVCEVQAVSVSNLRINLDDLLHARTVESERIEFKATWDQRVTLSCLGGNPPQEIQGFPSTEGGHAPTAYKGSVWGSSRRPNGSGAPLNDMNEPRDVLIP